MIVEPIAERTTPSSYFASPAEKPAKLSLKEQVRKHPRLAIGLGALALAGVAAVLGRGRIAKSAGPILASSLRAPLMRVAARRPLGTARLAARYPKVAARLAAGLR